MKTTHRREIHGIGAGGYAMCNILQWDQCLIDGDHNHARILCEHPETGAVFWAKQSMGTWCKVDDHPSAQLNAFDLEWTRTLQLSLNGLAYLQRLLQEAHPEAHETGLRKALLHYVTAHLTAARKERSDLSRKVDELVGAPVDD